MNFCKTTFFILIAFFHLYNFRFFFFGWSFVTQVEKLSLANFILTIILFFIFTQTLCAMHTQIESDSKSQVNLNFKKKCKKPHLDLLRCAMAKIRFQMFDKPQHNFRYLKIMIVFLTRFTVFFFTLLLLSLNASLF